MLKLVYKMYISYENIENRKKKGENQHERGKQGSV